MLAALRSLRDEGYQILLPDYLCEAQVHVLDQNKVDFAYYSLNGDLEPDLKSLESWRPRRCALVVINYFGLLDLDKIGSELGNEFPNFALVADCVQAPMDLPDRSIFPYAFTSLRKFLPVPDGAELFSPSGRVVGPSSGEATTFLSEKLKAARLKSDYISGNVADNDEEQMFLKHFLKGERALDSTHELYPMSALTGRLLSLVLPTEVRSRRRNNFGFLASELKTIGIEVRPLKENQVPLCLPLQTRDRDLLRSKLAAHRVFCPVHWPKFDRLAAQSLGAELADTEIGLVVDQRYTEADMLRQAAIVKRFFDESRHSEIRYLLDGKAKSS
jgi:hypothetical protein